MAGKQLDITIRGIDAASPNLQKILNAVNGVGDASAKSDKKTGSFWSTLAKFSGVAAVAGTVVGAFKAAEGSVAAFIATADRLDDIGDRAKALGISTQALSELSYTADLAGVGADELASSVATLEKNVSQFARTGKGKAADAIQSLGVNFRDSNGKVRDAESLLYDYLEAVSQIPDQIERVEIAQRLFGNDRILQFAADGGASLRQYAAEARALGVSFTQSQTDAGGALSDSIKRVEYAWFGLKANLVTAIGPDIAKVVNELASDVAAIPDVVKSIKDTVVDAYAGDADAKARLQKFWTDIETLAEVGSTSVWRVVKAGATLGLNTVLPYISGQIDDLIDLTASKGPAYAKKIAATFLPSLSKNTLGFIGVRDAISDEFGAGLRDQANEDIRQVDALHAKLRRQNVEASDRNAQSAFSGAAADYAAFNAVLTDARKNINDAVTDVAASGDAIGQFSQAIAKHRFSAGGQSASKQVVGDTEAATSDWKNFKAGIDSGLEQLRQKADDVAGFGRSSITSVVESLSGGLTNALYDAVTGTQSLGRAFRQFASDFFQQVAKMITQFLIFRAVTGLAKSAAGLFADPTGQATSITDAAAASSNQAPGLFQSLGSAGGSGNAFFGNLGGGLNAVEVPHFAGGGIVGGPLQSRDNVLALVGAGEGVLNGGAVSRNPGIVPYLNNGGSVQAGGGGGNISFNINVTMSGGNGNVSTTDARKTANTIVDAMMDRLAASPGQRERFRSIMGIPG